MKKRVWLFAIVLVALAFVSVGCGGDKNVVAPAPPRDSYSISVNYDLTIDAMIEMGHYDSIDPLIIDEWIPKPDKTGTINTDIYLVAVGRIASTDDAITKIASENLRPANIKELLAFGADQTEAQKQYPIAALGTPFTNILGQPSVVCLSRDAGNPNARTLEIRNPQEEWLAEFRFAAVPN